MLYNFDCENLEHAKSALILYAIYKSREANSPLSGTDTWSRFNAFIHGAWLKSSTMPEFVENLCHKARCDSIRPAYLSNGPVELPTGELVEAEGIKDYRLSIFGDNSLLPIIDKERTYLLLLVRERIQREKMEVSNNED